MFSHTTRLLALAAFAVLLGTLPASAQVSSIRVQCPENTDLHPGPGGTALDGSNVECLHVAAGDGFATMADGKPLYVFSFAPLSPIVDVDFVTPGIQVDPDQMMADGMLAANIPAPTIFVDEGDELYLTMTNVGMPIRPDLADPHSIHWHGFPQASSVFDGVPEASITTNMGASFTYYYVANDPGTYLYHCHVEATEHIQMGMIGNLYVRPRQDRCGTGTNPACPGLPIGTKYAYNDGDGTTRYDVDVPILITSMDPVFHDASATVQPLPFADMRDTYFLLNGRGYPDTVNTACLPKTVYPDIGESNGQSQCVSSLIEAPPNKRVLLRLSNVSVTEYVTIGTVGIPMKVIGRDARLLRGDNGVNQYYTTNSVTLGGGESADVIIDTTGLGSGQKYFLYAKNLHFLSNDQQNFGGAMTVISIQ